MKQAILLLSNKSTDAFFRYAAEVKSKVEGFGDFFLVQHVDKPTFNPDPKDKHLLQFTDNILVELGYTSISNTLIPGSNHFPLLDFYRKNNQYEQYWYIEDDVRYLPCWSSFFLHFGKSWQEYDFLSSHINPFNKEPLWCWWNTLTNKSLAVPNSMKIRSFNPIFRISNSALEFIDYCLLNGWKGHHEVLLPTLLNTGGFLMADLNGNSWNGKNICDRPFYLESNENVHGQKHSGSMRFRPNISDLEMNGSFLYHPFKEF